MSAASDRTAVYRLYDASEELLYVGISKDFGTRWKQHAKDQSWWLEVQSQTVRWHDSRKAAKVMETAAIKTERPIHNKQESPWEKHVKDDGTGFYVVPKVKASPKIGRAPRRPPQAVKNPQALRDLLGKRGVSVEGAAKVARVSQDAMGRICSGAESAHPKAVTFLAQGLGVSARRMQALCDAAYETGQVAK